MTAPFNPYLLWLGISPDQFPLNLYSLLGLEEFEDDRRLISQELERCKQQVMPHAQGKFAEAAKKVTTELQVAQQTLLDPARKHGYDQHLLRLQMESAQTAPSSAGNNSASPQLASLQVESTPTAASAPMPQASPTQPADAQVVAAGSGSWVVPLLVGGFSLVAVVLIAVLLLLVFLGRSEGETPLAAAANSEPSATAPGVSENQAAAVPEAVETPSAPPRDRDQAASDTPSSGGEDSNNSTPEKQSADSHQDGGVVSRPSSGLDLKPSGNKPVQPPAEENPRTSPTEDSSKTDPPPMPVNPSSPNSGDPGRQPPATSGEGKQEDVLQEDLSGYLAALKPLEVERARLLSERESVVSKLTTLLQELQGITMQYQQLVLAQRQVQQSLQQANVLYQRYTTIARTAQDPLDQATARTDAARVAREGQRLTGELATLSAQVAAVQKTGQAKESQVNNEKKALSKVAAQAESLQQQWFRLADPWGAASRASVQATLPIVSRWIEHDNQDAHALTLRSLLFASLLKYEEAAYDVSRAMEIDPKLPLAAAVKSHLVALEGDERDALRDALRDMNVAVKESPKKGVLYLTRGRVQARLGGYDRAVDDFRKSITCAERNPWPYIELARIYAAGPNATRRNGEKALEYAQTAMEFVGPSARWTALDALAAASAEAGDFDQAVHHQRQALALAPPKEREWCAARLELYQKKTPFRDIAAWREPR